MVKNGCGQSVLWTLKLTVSQEWTYGVDWFFCMLVQFQQVKRWLKNFWVSIVKNGCDSDRTLKLTVSEEWTYRITDFLNVDTWSQKLKADQKMFAHGTLKLTVSQKWTDEIK